MKQGLSGRNGMIAIGRVRDRCGKTAGVTKLTDVFQFQWTSSDSLANKWLKWVKLIRQVSTTSLGGDARETLTISGLERAKERSLAVFVLLKLGLSCVTAWISLCERLWIRVLFNLRRWRSVLSFQRVLVAARLDMRSRSVVFNCGKTGQCNKVCRQREKSAGKTRSSSSSAKSSGKGGKNHSNDKYGYCCRLATESVVVVGSAVT